MRLKLPSHLLHHLRAPLLLMPLFLIPLYAEAMSGAVTRGLRLCFGTVIPAVFPFMILSSLILHFSVAEDLHILTHPFKRLFHIGSGGLCAFLCGSLCGFPLGAKCAREAYEQGRITADECQRLIAFSSNASPAFLIAGVGALRKSVREGILLYLIMLSTAICIGILLGRKKAPSESDRSRATLDFSFTGVIENAGIQTLYVCSYLLFFSAVIGVLEIVFANNSLLYTLILPWLEISSACATLASAKVSAQLSFALTAFAVSFGGLSVHLQAAGILHKSGISMRTYYLSKLLQGTLSFIVAYLIFS